MPWGEPRTSEIRPKAGAYVLASLQTQGNFKLKNTFSETSLFFFFFSLQIFPPVRNTPDRTNPARINRRKAERGRAILHSTQARKVSVCGRRVALSEAGGVGGAGIFCCWNNCERDAGPPESPRPRIREVPVPTQPPAHPGTHRGARYRHVHLSEHGRDLLLAARGFGVRVPQLPSQTSAESDSVSFPSSSQPHEASRSFPWRPRGWSRCAHLRADDPRKATVAAAVAAGGQRA